MTNENKKTPDEIVDAEAKPEESEVAEWTIMIYMAGDNNLSDDCVNALRAVREINTKNDIHVVAQFDPADTRVSSQRMVMNLRDKNIPIKASRLMANESPSTLSKDYVKIEEGRIKWDPSRQPSEPVSVSDSDTIETNTADPKTLFDFISWSTEKCKAKRYMLVLSGHAGGIEDGYLLKDENPVHSMSLIGLMQVLRRVKEGLKIKLDILGMDSCLMSMIEICNELSPLKLVDVYVSSQSMTPNPGWPYGKIVEKLNKDKGKIATEEFAGIIVNEYVNSYVENAVCSGLSTDLAAVRIAASDGVVDSLRKFGEVLSYKLNNTAGDAFKRAIVHAHWEAQSYNGERFVDVLDFCDLAQAYCGDADVTAAVTDVRTAFKSMLVTSCFCGIDYQYSYGLSVYFPWSTIFSYYQNLEFAKATGADWFKFLDTYVEKTRRAPRGGYSRGPSYSNRTHKKVPPYAHGPVLPAISMRNPPRTWSKLGIAPCIERQQELFTVFDTIDEMQVP